MQDLTLAFDPCLPEIRNAAYAGKEITTHQYQINFNGWIGEGYIIIDPETGAGAYKIAGGGNGGNIVIDVLQSLFGFLGLSVDVSALINGLTSGPFGPFFDALGKLFQFLTFILGVVNIAGNPDCSIGSARYLILFHTLLVVLLIGAAALFAALLFPLLYAFILILAISFAMSQSINHAENLECRG